MCFVLCCGSVFPPVVCACDRARAAAAAAAGWAADARGDEDDLNGRIYRSGPREETRRSLSREYIQWNNGLNCSIFHDVHVGSRARVSKFPATLADVSSFCSPSAGKHRIKVSQILPSIMIKEETFLNSSWRAEFEHKPCSARTVNSSKLQKRAENCIIQYFIECGIFRAFNIVKGIKFFFKDFLKKFSIF